MTRAVVVPTSSLATAESGVELLRQTTDVEGLAMPEVPIRDVQEDDVKGIADILDELARERGGDSVADADGLRRAVTACIGQTDHAILVASLENGVAGYIAVHWVPFPALNGMEGYISDLFVRVQSRGGGIGNMLLQVVEGRARALHCRRLVLRNRMMDDSFTRGFYFKAGFTRREDYATLVKKLDPI